LSGFILELNYSLNDFKMKKLVVFLIGFLFTGILIAQDLSVDEIVSKNLQTIGQDMLMKVQTIKLTGKMTQGPAEFIMTEIMKKPEFDMLEMEIQGVKIIMSTDGKTGWIINPMTGSSDAQDLPPDMITSMVADGMRDPDVNWYNPFLNWKEKGTRIDLIGKEDMNGTPVYNLKLTFKDNQVVNYYVDASKFVVLKKKSTETAQGQTYEQETRYSDFRDFEGILGPAKTETLINGQVGTVSIVDKYEFDMPVDESVFKKPVKN
jgi:hypothetical protein